MANESSAREGPIHVVIRPGDVLTIRFQTPGQLTLYFLRSGVYLPSPRGTSTFIENCPLGKEEAYGETLVKEIQRQTGLKLKPLKNSWIEHGLKEKRYRVHAV